MNRALVFESSLTGHRGLYAALLARGLTESGVHVILSIPANSLDSAEANAHLSDILGDVQVDGLSISPGDSSQKLEALQHRVNQLKPDHVYVPYVDGMIQKWGMQLNPRRHFDPDLPIEGLMMRGAFAYPMQSIRQKYMQKISELLVRRSGWTRLHHLDPCVVRHLNQKTNRHYGPVRMMPEPVEQKKLPDRLDARQRLGVEDDEFVITCPGQLHRRKGTDLLIDAIRRNPDPKLKLVLLGPTAPDIKKQLQRHSSDSRIVWQDRYLDSAEFLVLFAAADLVCVPYPRHIGSATILIHAAKAGCSILASDWGWVGWTCQTYRLGMTCNVLNPDQLDQALVLARTSPPKMTESEQETRIQFLNYHTVENYLAHWTRLICERNSLPSPYQLFEFEQPLVAVSTGPAPSSPV